MKLKVRDRIVVTSIRPQPLDRDDVTPDLPAAEARALLKQLPDFFEEAGAGAEPIQDEADPAPQPDGTHGRDDGQGEPSPATPSVALGDTGARDDLRRAPETAAARRPPETAQAGRKPAATTRKPKG